VNQGKAVKGKYGIFLSAVFLLAGCADPASGTLHEVYKYPKELWGEWIRIDTGRTWYIASNYLEKDASSDITLSRKSDNVIEVVEGKDGYSGKERTYYLYASRIPNGSFNGTIAGDTARAVYSAAAGRSMAGIGGIDITVTNLNDKANEITAKTDNEGHFTADGTIPGDGYEITVGGQSTPVAPNTDGENIGTVTVTEGVNFKTSITSRSSKDMMLLYAGDEEYQFNITIANTGTDDCLAATYEITLPEGLTVSGSGSQVLGTIEPGAKKDIPVNVQCPSVSREFEYKTIEVAVTDNINKKIWNDSVSLRFNRAQVNFYIMSNSEVSGVVIVPTGRAYHFKTSYTYNPSGPSFYSASAAVPQYSKDFLVVFSGATADTEAKYSFGINTEADSNFDGFMDVGNYEPGNNEEASAPALGMGDKIMSYLHKNDIDYYKVNLGTPGSM
jgi:hypothetical protein